MARPKALRAPQAGMSDKQEPESPDDPKPAPVEEALRAVQTAMEDLAALLGVDSAATLDALKQARHAAAENFAGVADDARDLGLAKLEDLSAAVRRNPLAWLVGAVGVGLIIGLWRKGDRRS
jgi:hypothetical protein